MMKARNPESHRMPRPNDEAVTTAYSNVNLKVTEEEKWAFKEWCVHHRVTQVDAFREAFELLKKKHAEEDRMRSLCPIEIFGLNRLTLGWGTVRLGAHPGVPGELMCGDLAAVWLADRC